MRGLRLLLTLISASVVLAQSPAKPPFEALPSSTVPVTTITDLQPNTDTVQVTLKAVEQQPSTCAIEPITVEGPAQKSFSFSIPPDACIGLYKLTVASTAATAAAMPKNIDISSPQYIRISQPPPAVMSISPKAIYRGEIAQWTLVFLGPSTLMANVDYSLRFAEHAMVLCATKDPSRVPVERIDPKDSDISCYKATTSQDGQIAFSVGGKNFLKEFEGKQSVYLVLNRAESASRQLVVVNADTTTPCNYALGMTTGLALLILLLLWTGGKTTRTGSGRLSYLLSAFFIDEETQTYSLSKCQFYAWTVAALLGYIFFAVAKSVVQGSAVFPDIPGGLPAILLFSAGTSVVATGITNTKGSKGSGQVHPTLADFITTGGVVAPERLQFVVWTVAGIFTFLTIVFKSDPLALSELPRIPDGFMQLMGISSAGYLAGKLARKQGPVINVLAVVEAEPAISLTDNKPPDNSSTKATGMVLTLALQGEGLSPNASIKVDSIPLRADGFWVKGIADPQTSFCNKLNVSLNDASAYLEGVHTLTLVNPDAQAADALFPIDPLTIDSIEPELPQAAGPNPPTITVKGKNFKPGTKYEWKDATGKSLLDAQNLPLQDAQGDAVDVTDTQLKVNRPNDVIVGYKLTLSSAVGLQASYRRS